MMDTPRLALPLLDAGQAQKEITVNEALARLDLAAQACVESVGLNAPPGALVEGQAWIVGASPSGAWVGRAGAIAGWTAGGWRFVAPREGLRAWSAADAGVATWAGGQWGIAAQAAAIAAPTGGSVVDAEARAALAAVLAALRGQGLIAT